MTIEIIAEISGNHMGSFDRARELIIAAAEAGCTGVKFQCFEPGRLAVKRAAYPRIQTMIKSKDEPVAGAARLRELYQQTHTPKEWFPELITGAQLCKLTWHASAFDPEDVDFLETLGCPRYKIASFEVMDNDLLLRIINTRKPVIMSANQDENVSPCHQDWMVLHATNYGVTADKANLFKLRYWARDSAAWRSHWKYGLSDHTLTDDASIVAVALGARMIEWHIKLANTEPADNDYSWEPEAISLKVRGVRYIERCLHET